MANHAASVPWSDVLPRLRRYVASRVAPAAVDDVLGDVLLRLARSQEEFAAADNPAGWMFRIAKNVLADHHRRQDVKTRALQVHHEQHATSTTDSDDDDTAFAELVNCLRPLLRTLPEPYGQAVLLTDFDGLTQTAAAHKLGLSVSGMKSRVQRGRSKLKQAILRCCDVALDARGRVRELDPIANSCC